MKDIVIALIAIAGTTLWTAFNLGLVAFAIHYGWVLGGVV